ncbi:conserved domain protein [Salmonella enterica subsp. arizonae]|nr:conserved domain protein [Salmonella enterica subsp. arizonae]
MSDIEAQRIAERIDTVLDILVAGNYHSAINNLEILKAELLDQAKEGISPPPDIGVAQGNLIAIICSGIAFNLPRFSECLFTPFNV